MKRLLPPVLAALTLLLILGFWYRQEARWRSPLYCIEVAGQLWAGTAGPVPAGWTPLCPQSASYVQEVRAGTSRVETYRRAAAWSPYGLESQLRAAGWRVAARDPINDATVSVFWDTPSGRVQQLSERQPDGATVMTLSGRP